MAATSSSYRLVGDRDDFQVRKILVTAKFANIEVHRVDYDVLDDSMKKLCDDGQKLPALLLNETIAITQANAILRFIARKNPTATLYGETPEQSAQVDQWIDYILNELEVCASVLTYPLLGVKLPVAPSQESTTVATDNLMTVLKKMDGHLLDHMYLVFDKISVADVAAATACINVFKLILTEKHRSDLKNVTRWFYTCVNQPQFKDIVGVVSENAVPTSSSPAVSSVGETKVSQGNRGAGPASTSPAVVGVEYNTTLENGGLWRRNRTRIREIITREDKGVGLVGTTVEVAGWVKSLQKNMRFLQLGDGSCANTLQVVMNTGEYDGEEAMKTCGGQDACIRVIGQLVEGKRKENPVEIQASKIIIHGKNLNNTKYPIAKSRQGIQFETLRNHMHLRVRTTIMACVMRLRNACAFATHRFFQQRGFNYVHTPIITASDCEGAGEMFQVTTLLDDETNAKWEKLRKNSKLDKRVYKNDFFKKPAFMTVSGQLNVETYACALCDVYTFGPTFRAENSNTSRHLAEFWMIEPEIAFGDLDDNAKLAEDYLKYCIKYCFDNNMDDIQFLNGKAEAREAAKKKTKDPKKLQGLSGMTPQLDNLKRVLAGPFQRMTYTEAIDKLLLDVKEGKVAFDPEEEKKDPLRWGLDLRSEHERYLAEKVYRCPVIVTDYPKEFKAFYMRMNTDGKTVRAMDILAPGIGEIIGGSQREERLDVLEERIRAQDQDPEMYSWYCDLRRYGKIALW